MDKFSVSLRRAGTDDSAYRQYLADIAKIPLLSEPEEFEYAMKAKNGDADALRILIECNLRFVVSVAKQSVDRVSKLPDLINEGNLGLIIAAEKYDPTRGFKFISFAVWYIRQRINQYKAEHSNMIRLPGNKLALISKVKGATTILEQMLDRQPSAAEIAEYMDVEDVSVISNIIDISLGCIYSLDKPIDEDFTLLDVIPMNNGTLTDHTLTMTDRAFILKKLLSKLKPKHEIIIRLYYGLSDHKPLTLEEIGEMLGITREAVRQIRDKSIVKLKELIDESPIDFNDLFNA